MRCGVSMLLLAFAKCSRTMPSLDLPFKWKMTKRQFGVKYSAKVGSEHLQRPLGWNSPSVQAPVHKPSFLVGLQHWQQSEHNIDIDILISLLAIPICCSSLTLKVRQEPASSALPELWGCQSFGL